MSQAMQDKFQSSVKSRNGWLKNGNKPGDFTKAARCGATTRAGSSCRCPAMPNGRCKLHGGRSTGPRTLEGIERIRQANLRHGRYTAAAKEERRHFRTMVRDSRALLKQIRAMKRDDTRKTAD
jgi:hypothetical protein